MSKRLDEERAASLRANEEWAYKHVTNLEARVAELERVVKTLQGWGVSPVIAVTVPSLSPPCLPTDTPKWNPAPPAVWCQVPTGTTLGSNAQGDYIDIPAPPPGAH